ncbi:MAG: M20/M25/M40 family metallo-hydrolase [Immundisolibacteraceae bacterium]|nr:M20/M25/M40 family metallo-hydrolase [Immundisolibacteraceae bacterium]
MKSCRWGSYLAGLAGGLLLVGAAAFADSDSGPDRVMPTRERIQAAVDGRMPEAISALQRWISIRSVTDATDSYRDEKTRLLEVVAEKSRQLGFSARLVANDQVAIIDMDDQPPVIGILVHADVVPVADPGLWSHPPFSGQIADGAIWGRGASDDKGPIAATLYALAVIKDLGVELAGGVRVIVGTSEENMIWDDFETVAELGLAPARGWTADAAFPVVHAEKSFINAVVSFSDLADVHQTSISDWQGGTAPNSIPGRASLRLLGDLDKAAEAVKRYQRQHPEVKFELQLADGYLPDLLPNQLQIVAIGQSGHGSRPDSGINAITHLARMVASEGLLAGNYEDSAAARSLQFLGDVIGGSTDGASLGIIAHMR